MSGPWEAYQEQPAASGPWDNYAPAPARPASRPVGAAMAVQQKSPAQAQTPAAPEEESRIALESPDYMPPAARPGAVQPLSGGTAPPPAAPSPGRPWSSIPGAALRSLPESAGNFAKAVVHPFLHPIDTGNALLGIADGLGSKISRPGDLLRAGDPEPTQAQLEERKRREAPLDAVNAFFVDRYGSTEGFKNALATDPVGVAADVATVLTGGGALMARGPGMVGKAGQIATRAGAAVDPLTQTGNAIKLAGQGVEKIASNVTGMTTGAGAESVRAAGRAGREGGDAAKAFTENMRGDVPVENIVDLARSGLDKIRQERAAAYKAGKADLGKDKTVLDFNDIDTKVAKAAEVGTYKGQTVEPKAVAITKEMTDSIDAWKGLDPAEFHTPEGLDALKRTLGNIRDSTLQGSPERVAADRIYRAVRDEIAAQAPGYARMMEDYSRASDKLKEVGKTFSLGENATGDTAARKLQSATRDGAQTSWRKRGELLKELGAYEPDLPYAIAGQSLNALMPRGLVARGGGMMTAGSLIANPANALALPAFSPRIVGEAVYVGGKVVGTVDEVASALGMTPQMLRVAGQGAFQSGRAEDMTANAMALRRRNEATSNAFARP